jgi:peptide/nickel transport system permease protein
MSAGAQESVAAVPEVASGTSTAPVAETSVSVASQWRLMWWRFRKHRLAMVAAGVVLWLYLIALFADVLAPFDPNAHSSRYTYAPPQRLHLFDEGRLAPFVYDYTVAIDRQALRRTFVVDESTKHRVRLFARGTPYLLFGLIPADRHLLVPESPDAPMFLLGTDRLGHDLLSRLIHGTRVSMSIGLVGVTVSLLLGILLGGLSGYYGGWVDELIQRAIELIRSIPRIPLWLGLAAAMPLTWSSLRVYFAITIILSLIGWTGLARVVRGRFLSLREEDFVLAARLDGCSELRIIFRHMLPSFTSHIIASVTLAIPGVILAETALSFLGLGLRPPVVSWGVLLQDAQNVNTVATAPWLLIPGLGVVVAVLALNFLGDGLRDAADPYGR